MFYTLYVGSVGRNYIQKSSVQLSRRRRPPLIGRKRRRSPASGGVGDSTLRGATAVPRMEVSGGVKTGGLQGGITGLLDGEYLVRATDPGSRVWGKTGGLFSPIRISSSSSQSSSHSMSVCEERAVGTEMDRGTVGDRAVGAAWDERRAGGEGGAGVAKGD